MKYANDKTELAQTSATATIILDMKLILQTPDLRFNRQSGCLDGKCSVQLLPCTTDEHIHHIKKPYTSKELRKTFAIFTITKLGSEDCGRSPASIAYPHILLTFLSNVCAFQSRERRTREHLKDNLRVKPVGTRKKA